MRNIEKAKERAMALLDRRPHIDLRAYELYELLNSVPDVFKGDIYQTAADAWLFGLDVGYRLGRSEAKKCSHTKRYNMLRKQKEA